MSEISVRQARLDDTDAISRLFRAGITVWQKLDPRGQVSDVPYESLTIYERWQHGGVWMSIETAAVHLCRLLQGAGLALVAEHDGAVIGYAEAYPGLEPPPYGGHIHLMHLATEDESAADMLMLRLLDLARSAENGKLTVSLSGAHDERRAFYEKYGMKSLSQVQRYMLPARTGQSFYKISERPNVDADAINDWHMSIGRTESARAHWETLWTQVWDVIAEIRARKTHRLHISASGHEAFVACQQALYNPRSAALYCWSPKPLSAQLLVAIRDWAHKQNYRTLALVVAPDVAKLLGGEAETDPLTRQIYSIAP